MQQPYSIKNFLPLIFILTTVLAVTITIQTLTNALDATSLMSHFMGAFFLIFGAFKTFNLHAFATAYAEYDIVAKKSRLYALCYPCIELSLGIAYIFRLAPAFTNVITLIIMTIGSIGVAQALLQRKQIECACLGVVFKIPMTYVSLLEDLAMAIMALIMLLATYPS